MTRFLILLYGLNLAFAITDIFLPDPQVIFVIVKNICGWTCALLMAIYIYQWERRYE